MPISERSKALPPEVAREAQGAVGELVNRGAPPPSAEELRELLYAAFKAGYTSGKRQVAEALLPTLSTLAAFVQAEVEQFACWVDAPWALLELADATEAAQAELFEVVGEYQSTRCIRH